MNTHWFYPLFFQRRILNIPEAPNRLECHCETTRKDVLYPPFNFLTKVIICSSYFMQNVSLLQLCHKDFGLVRFLLMISGFLPLAFTAVCEPSSVCYNGYESKHPFWKLAQSHKIFHFYFCSLYHCDPPFKLLHKGTS